MHRTHYCGELRKEHMGQAATCCGWVQTRRDMGGVIFLDLKDREGVLQVVCDSQYLSPEDFHKAETVHMQSVIEVSGTIRHRDEETYNPRLATGEVELKAETAHRAVRGQASALLAGRGRARPRGASAQVPLSGHPPPRHAAQALQASAIRCSRPQSIISTRPGSIRWRPPCCASPPPRAHGDYLVPSRVHPGTFYALPQSAANFQAAADGRRH